jgi:signal transduction histidine kinase
MAGSDGLEVLLITPTGRDAELISDVLRLSGVQSRAFNHIFHAVEVFRARDVGALLIAEEALGDEEIAHLSTCLRQQPAWSLLPVLILTSSGLESSHSLLRERRRLVLGNTNLLERPVRPTTLVSTVKTALYMRTLQYERRASEASLRQSEKLALVGRMASSIAHEINNPLEAITNLLYLLDRSGLTPEQRGYLDTARQELMRVSEIAVQTLTFNRQHDIQGQASMSALLDSVMVLYQGRLAGSGIVIERRYQNTAPFTCYPGELRQVFANLIGNAFDATRNGGRITLRERAATDPKTGLPGVRITLSDNGHGMSPEVKVKLFQPFKSTKGIGGSGLGLWISKGIIEKHRGSIRFRSSATPGSSGTIFSIFVPTALGKSLDPPVFNANPSRGAA